MRVRLIETDPAHAASLRAVLRRAGLLVDEDPEPDVLVVALPAASASPSQAPCAPIVLLLGSDCSDELRPWIAGRPRWISLSKPTRPRALLAAIRTAASGLSPDSSTD